MWAHDLWSAQNGSTSNEKSTPEIYNVGLKWFPGDDGDDGDDDGDDNDGDDEDGDDDDDQRHGDGVIDCKEFGSHQSEEQEEMDLWKLSTLILLFEQRQTLDSDENENYYFGFFPPWYNWQAIKNPAPPCVLTRRQLVRSF